MKSMLCFSSGRPKTIRLRLQDQCTPSEAICQVYFTKIHYKMRNAIRRRTKRGRTLWGSSLFMTSRSLALTVLPIMPHHEQKKIVIRRHFHSGSFPLSEYIPQYSQMFPAIGAPQWGQIRFLLLTGGLSEMCGEKTASSSVS